MWRALIALLADGIRCRSWDMCGPVCPSGRPQRMAEFIPDVIDGGAGYSTEAAAKTALRNHRRADHQEPPQPGTCRCHCGNVHNLTWPETRTGERR